MILSELRTQTRNLLNEDVAGFWLDTQLNSYINLAMQRVNSIISSTREDYFTVSATFSTAANTKSYAFPTTCRYIGRLEIYDAADPNSIIKLDELKWPRIEANGDWLFIQSGKPQRYIIRGTQFDLYPIPDSVYTLRIYYDASKVDLASDSDAPATPNDYHDMIVYWACVLAKKQNDNDDAGFASIFNVRKAELIEFLKNRGGDDPRTVEAFLEGII